MGFIFFGGGGDTVKIKECTKMFIGFFLFFLFLLTGLSLLAASQLVQMEALGIR